MPAVERRLLAAIEELSSARRAAGLQPGRYVDEAPVEELDAEHKATEHRVAAYMADIDAALWGAFPEPLPHMTPPANPDAFLVAGFIRPGTTVMLTGPPGSSKSWAARQLAMAAAGGLDAFLDAYVIERPLQVLVVDEDNGRDEEWRRDEVLLAHLELQRSQLASLQRISLAGVQLDKEEWQHWLRGLIRLHQIDLVILDPISEMHGGKELREDPAFRSLLGFLKRLKVDFPGLATLLVHHTRKQMAGEKSADRGLDDVRGQWGQTPDAVALMWPLAERRVAWELHKRVPYSKLILEASPTGPLVKLEDQSTARSKRMETDDKVLSAIDGGMTTVADIVLAAGLSQSGAYKAVHRLIETGLISKGPPYRRIEERVIEGVQGDE